MLHVHAVYCLLLTHSRSVVHLRAALSQTCKIDSTHWQSVALSAECVQPAA